MDAGCQVAHEEWTANYSKGSTGLDCEVFGVMWDPTYLKTSKIINPLGAMKLIIRRIHNKPQIGDS